MRVYSYEKCSTCKKALAYLGSIGRAYELKAIRETPPTLEELRKMLKVYDNKLGRLFNTSGLDYRAMGLGEKLKTMKPEQALKLLSKNGNLVKRPFVTVGNTGMCGFQFDDWKSKGMR